MRNLASRIDKLEKKLHVEGRHTHLIIIGRREKNTVPEPRQEWITYKEMLSKVQPNQLIMFAPTTQAELAARRVRRK
jgi:hypothetical protein